MTDEETNQDTDSEETVPIEKIEMVDSTNQIEEDKGRDWRRYILGFAVIAIAVVIWYLLDLFL
jgi:hypothetical protein